MLHCFSGKVDIDVVISPQLLLRPDSARSLRCCEGIRDNRVVVCSGAADENGDSENSDDKQCDSVPHDGPPGIFSGNVKHRPLPSRLMPYPFTKIVRLPDFVKDGREFREEKPALFSAGCLRAGVHRIRTHTLCRQPIKEPSGIYIDIRL